MNTTTVDVCLPVDDVSQLLAHEAALDVAICGVELGGHGATRLRAQGAHDPTPTHYFVLDELFRHFSFKSESHLLDVGCGAGRVLAYFLYRGFPGKATGIELDPQLAALAQSWTALRENVEALQGNVLELDLSQFTDFYLFNPFDSDVLQKFIARIEAQVARPCTVVHMSDNGDTWWYMGRQGWTKLASGEILSCRNARGLCVDAYDSPQHYTVWRYDGEGGREPSAFPFSFAI